MGSVGGYLPSAAANQGFQNTLMSLATLQETRRRNQEYALAQEDLRATREMARQKQAREQQEQDIGNIAIGLTGLDYTKDPGVQQAMFPTRQLMRPGALYTETGPITTTPDTQSVTLMSRPPTRADLMTTAEKGVAKLKATRLDELTALGMGPGNPYYDYLARSSQVVPGAGPGVIQEVEKTKQAQTATEQKKEELDKFKKLAPIEVRTAEAKATGEEVSSRIAQATEKSEIERRQSEARNTTANMQINEAKVAYAKHNEFLENQTKQLNALLKKAELEQKPLEAAQIRANINKLNLQGQEARNRINEYEYGTKLYNAWLTEKDPVKQDKILEAMAASKGQAVQLLNMNIDQKKAAVNHMKEASDSYMDAYKLSQSGTPEGIKLAQRRADDGNRASINASIALRSPKTQLTIFSPEPRGVFGGTEGIAVGNVTVDTQAAIDYNSRKLHERAMDQDPNPSPVKLEVSGKSLGTLARIATAYAVKDPAAIQRFISDSNATPAVKEVALKYLNEI